MGSRSGYGAHPSDFEDLATSLRGSTDWRPERTLIQGSVSTRPADALALAYALDAEMLSNGFDLAIYSVRQGLFDQVVGLDSEDATDIAIDLVLTPGPSRPGAPATWSWLARQAFRLAAARPADELLASIGPDSSVRLHRPELGLLIFHELVLRGGVLADDNWYCDWARRSSHPLATLPTSLLDLEGGFGFWLPTYASGVTGAPLASLRSIEGELSTVGELIPGLGTPVEVDRERIAASFREWREGSNGEVEIAAFTKGDAFGVTVGPALDATVRGAEVAVAEGLGLFFSWTVASGAYSHGPGGAFARLRTWEAVAGLLGRTWPMDIHPLADEIRDSKWIRLETDDPWFYQVAWDVFLAVDLASRIVTIAVTDTD